MKNICYGISLVVILAVSFFVIVDSIEEASAHKFLESSPTYLFDGDGGGMSNNGFIQTDTILYLLEGRFTSANSGYGDRTGQDLIKQKTPHSMALLIRDGIVEYTVMDNQWDMINQEIIYHLSEDFKDFELRYSYHKDEENTESLHVESQPGILRAEGLSLMNIIY